MKRMNKKGFTLAELLIVVAIIAVLVAIAIPVFTGQLERARETADLANIRSAYAEVVMNYMSDNENPSVTVKLTQTRDSWNYVTPQIGTDVGGTGSVTFDGNPTKGGTATVSIEAPTGTSTQETVKVTFSSGTTPSPSPSST